jgi:hypothetical protein
MKICIIRGDSMGKIFEFPKKNNDDNTSNHQDVFVLKLMKDSPIKAEIRILPEELHVVLRVLFKERKDAKECYQQAVATKNKEDMEFWKTISETLQQLINKLKNAYQLEEIIQELSFIELDCLVGSIEQYLHQVQLLELQMIEDESPIITEQLYQVYEKILPIYEENRGIFGEEHGV